jgi:hypothetical protein
MERLADQCVAMSGLCLGEMQALVQGLSAGCADAPAVSALKAHLESQLCVTWVLGCVPGFG